ncbi:MAG: pyroglutamyl-peptidase I [Clostridia bacterium]|nr:pyroglutamyl-peptidase I [Clostridia bacterium]
MPNLLITGFDPFDGETVNPAWEAVKRLPDTIGGWTLHKLEIPTVFADASRAVIAEAQRIKPDAVICVGQAGGRAAVTPEMVGINLRYGRIADNVGCAPQDEPVAPGAPAAYFATLPVRAMAEAVSAAGIPAAVSYSAGAFVCNDVLYSVLHHFNGTDVRSGFIHVPFLPEQAKPGVPSMPLDDIVRALEICIQTL